MKKAVKAIILKEDKILLLKRNPIYSRKHIDLELNKFKEKDIENIWDLPGGGLEKEESEIQALNREVKEELNINIKIIKKSRKWSFVGLDGKKVEVTNYICEKINSNKIKLSDEHLDYKWVKLNDIYKYKVKDDSFYESLKNI